MDSKSNINLPHEHDQNISNVLGSMPQIEDCAEVADMFKQVCDASRLRIFWLLCHCEECVTNIAAAMQMTEPAVSHHLKVLKKSGLLVSRRDGKEVYYKISDNEMSDLLHHACEAMFKIKCPNR